MSSMGWAGVGAGLFDWFWVCQYMASGVQMTMFLSCRLLCSCSIRDHIDISGVVAAVGRWHLHVSVGGNVGALSGGAVGSSVRGKGQTRSMFLQFRGRRGTVSIVSGCSNSFIVEEEGGRGKSCGSCSWEEVFVLIVIIICISSRS